LFSLLFCCLLLSACSRKPDDQLIVQEVQARFFQDTTLKARDIHVACADGSVTLAGEVNQESEKLAAGHLAGQVPGVKQVVISLNVVTVATATGSNSTPPQTPAPAPPSAPVATPVPVATGSNSTPPQTPAPAPPSAPVATPVPVATGGNSTASRTPPSAPPSAPAATSVPVATRGNSTAPRTPPSAPSPVTTATSGSQGTTSPAPVAKTWNDPIDQYLARKPSPKTPSPLTGRGPVFESDGKQYTIDPRLIVAISGAETSFAIGKCHKTPVTATRNAWNWFWCYGNNSCGTDVCNNSAFDTWDSGIKTVSKYVERNYVMKGLTDVRKIQTKYCTEGCDYWVKNVDAFMQQMGGDPENLTLASPNPKR
jgi:hypothetical protein